MIPVDMQSGQHVSREEQQLSSRTDDVTQVYGVSDEDRLAVETLYRAFSEDPELLDDAVTEDWQDIPLAPGQAPGREGMKPLIASFRTAFPDAHVTMHELIGVPGHVAVRAEITGTHKGEWFGAPATDKPVVITIHEFHYVDNGRLTHT